MTTHNEALLKALEALKFYANPTVYDADSTGRRDRITHVADDAIKVIEAAKAPPEQPDAELLNFLSQRGNVVIRSDDENNQWFVELLGGTEQIVTVCRGVTLRIAIHAAIAAGGAQT